VEHAAWRHGIGRQRIKVAAERKPMPPQAAREVAPQPRAFSGIFGKGFMPITSNTLTPSSMDCQRAAQPCCAASSAAVRLAP
jgi:hypothetical protein